MKATIVFLDESGLSERPQRVRTWGPRGQTPVLPDHFHGETWAVIAGMTFVHFYFPWYAGTIQAPPILQCLAPLRRHRKGKLILLGDRRPAHRSRLVQDSWAGQRRIPQEGLPADAPELHPVEYLWGQLKEHPLGHFCPDHGGELSAGTRRALRRLRQRRGIIACCWKQAELSF